MRRTAAVVTGVAVAAAVILSSAGAAQASAASEESQFVSLLNGERASRGIKSLTLDASLVEVARRHSREMAASKSIWHNPNLATDVKNWVYVGENVGRGTGVQVIHEAFMDSPAHRANILDTDYRSLGIGVAHGSDGLIYVTEVFATFAKTGSGSASGATLDSSSTSSPSASSTAGHAATVDSPSSSTVAATPAKPAAKQDPGPARAVAALSLVSAFDA
ncbi:MAG TPA: CAP domain-containing protein [Actinomycetota bacterium]